MSSDMVPLAEHSKLGKYFRMLRMGLPRLAVLSAMRVDGVEESLLDRDPAELVPDSPLPLAYLSKEGGSRAAETPLEYDLPHLAKEGDLAVIAQRLSTPEGKETINSRDRRLNTPLMQAVLNRRADVARLLLEHGADTELKSYVGHRSVYSFLASLHSTCRMVELLFAWRHSTAILTWCFCSSTSVLISMPEIRCVNRYSCHL